MNHLPWYVKGIDPETREAARDAARRSGIPVGKWLNSLIIDSTGAPSLPPSHHTNSSSAAPDAAAVASKGPNRLAAMPHAVRSTRAAPAVGACDRAAIDEAICTGSIGRQIEDEVRTLNARIASLQAAPRVEDIANALRNDLAELGNSLRNAMPTSAIATLEREVRALGERIEANRASMADGRKIAAFEFAPLAKDIHALAERLSTSDEHRADPNIMTTLDQRLAEIANAIARRPSESAPPPAAPATPTAPAIPPNFETLIKQLADRLVSTEIPAGGPAALRSLERRLVHLADKIDASEARLGSIEGVERGIGDLLIQLKELRTQNERKLAAIGQQLMERAAEAVSGPAEAMRREVAALKENQGAAAETFEAVYAAVERVVDRLAVIEQRLDDKEEGQVRVIGAAASGGGLAALGATMPAFVADGPPITPAPADPSSPSAIPESRMAPAGVTRRPIGCDPSGTAVEGSAEARRIKTFATAFDRLAASESANDGAAPATGAGAGTSAKSGRTPGDTAAPIHANLVAAARRAARSVASGRVTKAQSAKPAADAQNPRHGSPALILMQRVGPMGKSVILGVTAILLVLGALRPAFDLLRNPDGPAPPLSQIDDSPPPDGAIAPSRTAELDTPPASVPLAPPNSANVPEGIALKQLPAFGDATAVAQTSLAAAPIPASVAPPDTTGSLTGQTSSRQGAQSRNLAAPLAVPPGLTSRVFAPLPARIGGKALLDAAAGGEPGASYEIAVRFAEGRTVPQDLAQAAAWFDRAAHKGLAVAQLRLGSMYEKGLGVKQDRNEARRLYLAAADKGNAEAMHNLAVLYAEKIDGKPDFALASQWFREAASFGLAESQYNLALLYARGVGVERDLTQSYKWFALAAKNGDRDAANARDETAARLDPQSLASAQQAVDAFTPASQPSEATDTMAPPGGWDRLAAIVPARRKGVQKSEAATGTK